MGWPLKNAVALLLPLNTFEPILLMLPGSFTFFRLVHPEKVLFSIHSTQSGNVISSKDAHASKALSPIFVVLGDNSTDTH